MPCRPPPTAPMATCVVAWRGLTAVGATALPAGVPAAKTPSPPQRGDAGLATRAAEPAHGRYARCGYSGRLAVRRYGGATARTAHYAPLREWAAAPAARGGRAGGTNTNTGILLLAVPYSCTSILYSAAKNFSFLAGKFSAMCVVARPRPAGGGGGSRHRASRPGPPERGCCWLAASAHRAAVLLWRPSLDPAPVAFSSGGRRTLHSCRRRRTAPYQRHRAD